MQLYYVFYESIVTALESGEQGMRQATDPVTEQRTVAQIKTAHASRDGDGVAILRISGMQEAGMDPVLLLDELRSDYRRDFAGGFPPHPHRGIQTLTYMKQAGFF